MAGRHTVYLRCHSSVESRKARRDARGSPFSAVDAALFGLASDESMAERGDRFMSDRLFARIESLFDVKSFDGLEVMVAGCGSGGGQVALQLAMSGLKRFTLVDKDELEVENVIRHVCGIRYLGQQKTAAVADVLRDRNPTVEVREFNEDLLGWRGLEQEVERASVVVIGTDNEPTRYRLNEVCVETATPFTVGRVFTRGIGGEVYTYKPSLGGCLACLERLLERSQYRGRCARD